MDSKFPDFQVPRNLARARFGPGWAGLGPGGPLGWAGRVFWVGRVVRGNCELICFLKDCLCAQAPEEIQQVKCSTCGQMKDVNDMKMVQSEDLINGWRAQTRCRDCTNLRPRLARLIKPGSEVVRGYEKLTAKGRTFVPSIHVAYEHGNFVQFLMTVMTSHLYVGAIFTTDCRACIQDEMMVPTQKCVPDGSQ